MNKADLVARIADAIEVSSSKAEKAFSAVIEGITDSLSKGEAVSIIGFGNFSVKSRAARTGRNPQTGEEMKIAATKVAHFKAGQKLKDAVKG